MQLFFFKAEEAAAEGGRPEVRRPPLDRQGARENDAERLENLPRGLQHCHQGRQHTAANAKLEGELHTPGDPRDYRQDWLQRTLAHPETSNPYWSHKQGRNLEKNYPLLFFIAVFLVFSFLLIFFRQAFPKFIHTTWTLNIKIQF